MEQSLIDYLTNATWQIPLLAGGAWVFIRVGKFGPRTQHCIWLAVLALAIGLPLRGVHAGVPAVPSTSCNNCGADATAINERNALPPAAIVTQFIVADPRLVKEFFTFPRPTLRLSPVATSWLVGIYFATLFFGLYRILTSWRRARKWVKDADPAVLPPQWQALFQGSVHRVGSRLPQLRKSADVRSPVIVGAMHPVLLLPDNFDDHSRDEVQAVFFHELAHVRRHDYLSNLLCRVAALPVAWHPVMFAVQERIRRTREMVCDDIAARAMQSEIGYAKCLLAMAARTLGQHDHAHAAQAIGLFGGNVLEERIMRLMLEKKTMTMQQKLIRTASGAVAMILAIAMAACFHVIPTLAQTSGAAVTVPAPAPPPAPSAPDLAVASLPPAPPQSHPAAAPAPAEPPMPAPDVAVAPVVPTAPDEAAPPVAPVAPIPPAAPDVHPSPRKKKVVGHQPKRGADQSFVIDSNGEHAMTPEQQAQFQKDMAALNARIAEATRRFNTPEFQRQMAEIAEQQASLKHLNKVDMVRMQQQIDAVTAKINSPEFQRQMAEIAEQQANLKHMNQLDMVKMQQQIDAATAKINSPEFQQQMEKLQKQIQSAAMQRSLDEAARQLKAAGDRMRESQTK